MERIKHWIPAIYVILLIATLALILTVRDETEEVIRVGYITADTTGWNGERLDGIRNACQAMDVELLERTGVPGDPEACREAVDDLAREGAGMIVLGSLEYAQGLESIITDHPDIYFYGFDAEYSADNFVMYSGRMYQARYMSGIIAGYQTKTGKIGFVASYPNSEVLRGINAFALGVQRVNPDAEVIVNWSGGWSNETAERAAAAALIEKEKVDVITLHQDRPYVIEEAERRGIASIGYLEDVENPSELYLTCVDCDWTQLYQRIIREYLKGHISINDTEWMGLESDAVYLTGYSPLVRKYARDEVAAMIAASKAGWRVFSGEIYDNQGRLRCKEDESISDNTLLWGIDWLVKGVREYDG